ncbi:MAG: pyridoxamine 5'-phosphate oxidase family protein [Pseudomonadota bacterium]
MTILSTIEELEAIYGKPGETSLIKEVPEIIPQYKAYIEASPFCTLATAGPEGLDCSPRGDVPGFVRVHDDRTLMMPDRRGNNRTDSLKNIVRDPRVAICFLIPGSLNALRVNGEAHLTVDEDLKKSFAINGKEPRSVIVIKTMSVYFQCGRAIVRSKLWDPEQQVDPASLPTPGDVLAELSKGTIGGPDYDAKWDGRAKETLW